MRLRALMKYADTQVAESPLSREIDKRIEDERMTQRLRSEYMTYQMKLDETWEEATRAKALQTARNLLSMGLGADQAAQATGLSVDEVQALR